MCTKSGTHGNGGTGVVIKWGLNDIMGELVKGKSVRLRRG